MKPLRNVSDPKQDRAAHSNRSDSEQKLSSALRRYSVNGGRQWRDFEQHMINILRVGGSCHKHDINWGKKSRVWNVVNV
jgi:hypothetical protein